MDFTEQLSFMYTEPANVSNSPWPADINLFISPEVKIRHNVLPCLKNKVILNRTLPAVNNNLSPPAWPKMISNTGRCLRDKV